MNSDFSLSRDFSSLIKYSGKFNFNFSLNAESSIFYLASNLVAEARDPDSNLVIPSKCRWFRIRGEKAYNLNAITGNVY